MIVYIDIIMLFDFIINLVIMYAIEKCFTSKVCKIKILIPSVISSLFIPLSFFNYVFFKIFKLFGGIIIYFLSFEKSSIREKTIKISMFYLINLAFIGLLKTFDINQWYLLFISIIVLIIIIFIQNNKNYYIFLRTCKYNVIVKNGNNECYIEGFLDTGNRLTYKGIPIVIIDTKYKDKLGNFPKTISFTCGTVNNITYETGYKPTYFIIEVNKVRRVKKVIILFKNIDEECLLNSCLI